MVLKPGREAMAEAIFHKWELDFAVIGEVTDTGRMVLDHQGETVCDIPLAPLADDAPCYDRPHIATPKRETLKDVPENTDIANRSEEHTSELQSLMRISYAVFFLKKKHK